MATSTQGILNINVSWNQSRTEDNSTNTLSDIGQISYQKIYTTGASGYINDVFHEMRTLGSGGVVNYNLTGLEQVILNTSATKSFANIKSITIKNASSTSGFNVNINLTSASGFDEPFGRPTSNIVLGPNSIIHANNYFSGYIVDANNRHIQINDMGSGAQIEMLLMGY